MSLNDFDIIHLTCFVDIMMESYFRNLRYYGFRCHGTQKNNGIICLKYSRPDNLFHVGASERELDLIASKSRPEKVNPDEVTLTSFQITSIDVNSFEMEILMSLCDDNIVEFLPSSSSAFSSPSRSNYRGLNGEGAFEKQGDTELSFDGIKSPRQKRPICPKISPCRHQACDDDDDYNDDNVPNKKKSGHQANCIFIPITKL